jgi:uncharacterized protein (DUF2141 family)
MFNFLNHYLKFKIAKKANFLASISLIFLMLLLFSLQGKAQDIRIIPEGLKKAKGGKVIAGLFNSEQGFPDASALAVRMLQFSINEPIEFKGIPPGMYAVVLLHDLDGNGDMTYSFLGIPKDGFSSSPDGGSAFSKPVFRKCRFRHGNGETQLNMKIHYLF